MLGTFPLTNGGARYLCSSVGSVGKIVKNIIRNYFINICICDIMYVTLGKILRNTAACEFPTSADQGKSAL